MGYLLKKKVKSLIRNLFILINELFPKQKNKWVFISIPDFADNSKAFFEYIRKFHPEINGIWLCTDENIVRALRENSINAYLFYSVKGLYHFITASVILTTHNQALSLVSSKQCYVSLWHGFGIKSSGFKDKNDFKHYLEIENFLRKINIFPVSSRSILQFFKSAFHVPSRIFVLSGQPRVCKMFLKDFDNYADKINLLNKLGIKVDINTTLMLYLPTFRVSCFRQDGTTPILEILSSDKYFSILSRVLKKNNAVLLIKLHPLEEQMLKFSRTIEELRKSIKLSDNIYLIPSRTLSLKLVDIYDILKFTDILITDYSSVYIDFLAIDGDRKMIFYPFDIDTYLTSRDLELYPYEKWTPGPKVYTLVELIEEIQRTLLGLSPKLAKKYKAQKSKIVQILYETPQENACDRIYEKIISCIKKLD